MAVTFTEKEMITPVQAAILKRGFVQSLLRKF
jgi:hypothetical protein